MPIGAADLAAGVDQPGRGSRVGAVDTRQAGDRHRDERETHAGAAENERREEIPEVVPVHRQPGEQRHRQGGDEQPGDERRPNAHAADDDLRDVGRDHDGQREPGERDAALHRRVVEDVLQVERQDEELRERHRTDDRHRAVRRRQRPRAEDPHRQQRGRRAQLDQDERGHESSGRRQQAQGPIRAPAVGRRARHRVDEQHQPGRDRQRAGDIEVAVGQVRAALTEQHRRQNDGRDADRNVDEEDPGPAQVRREQPAEQDAGGGAAPRGRAVDPEREIPFPAFREGRHQQRERRRSEQRAAETLQRAERDQRSLRPREAAQERADREQRQAGDEHPPAPEEVGEPSAEEQGAAEHDRVGGDHPLQARLGETEVRLDRRQRDVHNRHVEDDHELCCDDERQCAPPPLADSAVSH